MALTLFEIKQCNSETAKLADREGSLFPYLLAFCL